jgi:GPH family glycoside/pentoside/hexuronide:cation symporter
MPSTPASAPPPSSPSPPADADPEIYREPEAPTRKELINYACSGAAEGTSSQLAQSLATPLLNIGLGINPALISLVLSLRGLLDAVTDPIFGHLSDNFRSRWGRRRPFILVGGILVALCVSGIWMFPTSWSQTAIMTWFTAGLFLLALSTTIFSISHFALGIEMAPNYDERTRVVAYKSFVSKFGMLLGPWMYPLCLLPVFPHEIVGARTISITLAVLCVAAAVWTFLGTRERTQISVDKPREKFLPAVRRIASNRNFLRVTFIYVLMISMLQLFNVFGLYINIYYVFQGDKAAGASMAATVSSLGSVLAIFSIPVVTWLCKRIQKHNTLKIALGMMITGDVLKWFLLKPETPYAQLVLPFCFGLGISSVFIVLSAMQADLVDEDELVSGQRREGIFSSVAGWMMKSAGSVAGALSGVLIVATGFDVALGAEQAESTIFWMRICNSFAPGAMVATCLLLLIKYPLTRERMEEIHDILVVRRKADWDTHHSKKGHQPS